MNKPNILYFSNSVVPDEFINDTHVVKLHTDTLNCHVIYMSKFKIVNLSMVEIKNDLASGFASSLDVSKSKPIIEHSKLTGSEYQSFESDRWSTTKLNMQQLLKPTK